MTENKIHTCGGEQKAQRNKEKVRALAEVAVGVGAMAVGGVLYKAGFAIGSSAADGHLGGAVSMAGGVLVVGGVIAAGTGVARFAENSPNIEKAFTYACKNATKMNTFTKNKLVPFVKKTVENIKNATKSGVDITDHKGKYVETFVGNGKYVAQPHKIMAAMLGKRSKE